jgi:dGTPase
MAKFPGLTGERYISQTISHLIGILIDDLVDTTRQRIHSDRIASLDDVRNKGGRCVSFSEEMSRKNKQLKQFLWKKLYTHYKVERMRVKSTRLIRSLFENYAEHPTLLPHSYQDKYASDGQMVVICDYIAGMTDRYAMDEYKRLFDPYERV